MSVSIQEAMPCWATAQVPMSAPVGAPDTFRPELRPSLGGAERGSQCPSEGTVALLLLHLIRS